MQWAVLLILSRAVLLLGGDASCTPGLMLEPQHPGGNSMEMLRLLSRIKLGAAAAAAAAARCCHCHSPGSPSSGWQCSA